MNDLDKAEDYYEKCRVLNRDIEDYKNESKAIAKLVKIAKIKGDHSKAKILEAERKRTWDLSNS